MKSIFNNLRRMFRDDGRHDRDFSDRELQLAEARRLIGEAATSMTRAAEILADVLRIRS